MRRLARAMGEVAARSRRRDAVWSGGAAVRPPHNVIHVTQYVYVSRVPCLIWQVYRSLRQLALAMAEAFARWRAAVCSGGAEVRPPRHVPRVERRAALR